jgi:hypothetical protein
MAPRTYKCPICGYKGLEEAPYAGGKTNLGVLCYSSFEICACCGVEFGVQDYDYGEEFGLNDYSAIAAGLRERWIVDGCRWRHRKPPSDWSPEAQLRSVMGKSEFEKLADKIKRR